MRLHHPTIWIGFVPLWIAVAFGAFRVERYLGRVDQVEVMRGESCLPSDKTPNEIADEVAGAVEAIRMAGSEPERYLFDLPRDWSPPDGWTPPEGWQPPIWWPQ